MNPPQPKTWKVGINRAKAYQENLTQMYVIALSVFLKDVVEYITERSMGIM